jgi:hypothetical protein
MAGGNHSGHIALTRNQNLRRARHSFYEANKHTVVAGELYVKPT